MNATKHKRRVFFMFVYTGIVPFIPLYPTQNCTLRYLAFQAALVQNFTHRTRAIVKKSVDLFACARAATMP